MVRCDGCGRELSGHESWNGRRADHGMPDDSDIDCKGTWRCVAVGSQQEIHQDREPDTDKWCYALTRMTPAQSAVCTRTKRHSGQCASIKPDGTHNVPPWWGVNSDPNAGKTIPAPPPGDLTGEPPRPVAVSNPTAPTDRIDALMRSNGALEVDLVQERAKVAKLERQNAELLARANKAEEALRRMRERGWR